MILITWFTSHKKRRKNQRSDCPYKMEPEPCGISLEKQSGLSEKRLKDVLKQGMKGIGRKMQRKLTMPWLKVMLIALVLCLNACESKVVLLKESDMRLMDNGNYSVSPAWMEERLHFENDMVKRLQECHSTN